MPRTVLINNVDHKNLRVIARRSAAFGDNVNQVLVFPTEFQHIQREYPILIRKDSNGAYQAVALLGFDKGENLFLDEGGWRARYVPAMLERGPFVIGKPRASEGVEPLVGLDLDHPAVSETEGEPLFLPQGGSSPYLERMARTLLAIDQGVEVSGPMFAAFDEADLIEPAALEIIPDARTQYNVPDVFTVNETSLMSLDGATLERLNRVGYLRAAYQIVSSLGNMAQLIEAKRRRRGVA